MARTTWGPLSTDEQNSIEFAPVGEPGVLVAGTAGGLLKRNADGTMGNSILSESGSVLTAAGRLVIGGGTVTASTPVLDLSQTWNNGAVTFYGMKFNVTDTASISTSQFAEFQVGGSTKIGLYKSGSAVFYGNLTTVAGSITLGNTVLSQGSVNTLDLRNLANAQTLNVFGTADAGLLNYRRIRTTMTTGGAATIAAEGLGTGVSGNTLAFAIGSSAAPTTVLSFDSSGNATIAGTVAIGGAAFKVLSNAATYDASSISAGSFTSTTVAVTGATVGSPCTAGLTTLTTQGLVISANVHSAGVVSVVLFNPTGSPVDLGSGALKVNCFVQ